MSDQPSPSSPSSSDSEESLPVFPVAAVVVVVIASFLLFVVLLLVIRKCLLNQGVEGPRCSLACCPDSPECGEGCKEVAERLDCRTPDCQAWLDNICPSKQQCALWWGQVGSCYCCYILADSCKEINICPDCSAFQCPDCDCCGECCHCALKAPECSEITCLCFECGRPSGTAV